MDYRASLFNAIIILVKLETPRIMKEIILKLLRSSNKDDVILAANLMFNIDPSEALETLTKAFGNSILSGIITTALPLIEHYQYYKYGDTYVFFGHSQIVVSRDTGGNKVWPINYKP